MTGVSDEGGEAEGDVEGRGQGGSPADSTHQPGKPGHMPVCLRRKRHKTLANKVQDFQVLSEFHSFPW